jgi:Sec-independent protein translocase protein TatA
MNFFGIGGAELVLILLIMIVVAGPKRMIHWAYIMGTYVAKARQWWGQAVDVLQSELDASGVDVKLPKTPPTRADVARMINEVAKPMVAPVEQTMKEISDEAKIDAKPIEAKPFVPKDVSKLPTTKPNVAAKPATPVTPPASSETEGFGTWGNSNGSANGDFGSWSNGNQKGS